MPLLLKNANNMQDLGQAITYARRYNLSCLLQIITTGEDQDGNMQEQAQSVPEKKHSPEELYSNAMQALSKALDEKDVSRLVKIKQKWISLIGTISTEIYNRGWDEIESAEKIIMNGGNK
jgi:hypothetical protein